jgi:hypothetical protein
MLYFYSILLFLVKLEECMIAIKNINVKEWWAKMAGEARCTEPWVQIPFSVYLRRTVKSECICQLYPPLT